MAVDYRQQYTPQQLAPFWPDEVIRLAVVALCTLAVITVLAILPVILNAWGLEHLIEESEPADARVTPEHIRPEWYFLAVYQHLKVVPQEFLGLSGKTVGVLSQGVFMLAVMLLPFWARRGAHRPPGRLHRVSVTLVIAVFLVFTLWAVWPPPVLLTIAVVVVLLLFYTLLTSERRNVRRVLRR